MTYCYDLIVFRSFNSLMVNTHPFVVLNFIFPWVNYGKLIKSSEGSKYCLDRENSPAAQTTKKIMLFRICLIYYEDDCAL